MSSFDDIDKFFSGDPIPLLVDIVLIAYVHVMDMPIILENPPAIMSSRMVVMMTPEDKRAIEQRAHSEGVTPSELIRRAARDYDPADPQQEAALAVLAGELELAVAGMRRDLGSALDELAAHRAEMTRIKAGRAV